MSSAGSRAGIHLDGTTAVVVIAHGSGPASIGSTLGAGPGTHRDLPTVEATHEVSGTTAADALARALKLVPATYRTRVTVSAVGVQTAVIDVTSTHLTRRGFTEAARGWLPGAQPTSPIAGLLGDLTRVQAGELESGLAFTAPGDLIDDLYATAADRPVEITTTSAAAAAAGDGIHLCLRRDSVELFIVTDGRVVLDHLLDTPGFNHLLEAVNHQTDRFDHALAGGTGDPLAAAVLTRLLTRIFEEAREVLDANAAVPGAASNELTAHGIGTRASELLGQAMDAGFRLQHRDQIRGVEATGFDAWCAAVTAGQNMPYAAFLNSHRVTQRRAELTSLARRRLARVAVAYLVAVTLGAFAPAAAAMGWSTWAHARTQAAYTAAAKDPVRAQALADSRLAESFAADTRLTRAVAFISEAARTSPGVDLTRLSVTDDVAVLEAEGSAEHLRAFLADVRTQVVLDTVGLTGQTVTLRTRGTPADAQTATGGTP